MERLLKEISENKILTLSLKVYSHACVLLSVILFVMLEYKAYESSLTEALSLAVSLAVPFLVVSVLRVIINAPRPYEVLGIYENLPKNKRGRSFPSRHAFSVFAIAVTAFPTYPALAVTGIILGVGLCIARVLLGIHFVRDVLAGALIGIASAAFGLIIL
ncbi:MAG: phosphatase PAP2 family protein [Clostridia bacterium]|nr:phosphatase PAP2 family protein [Clostridia bacterium]